MTAKTYKSPHNPNEVEVINGATGYVVTGFLGRAQFHKEHRSTADEARVAARAMATALRRTVIIYAIMGSRQAVLETCDPPR